MPAKVAVPSGVSREVLFDRLNKMVTKAKNQKDEAARVGENVTAVAVAGGTALGVGVLYAKFPEAAKIPGTDVDTDLAGGIALTAIGALGKGKMSGATMFAGLGLLLPWLRDKGAEMGA